MPNDIILWGDKFYRKYELYVDNGNDKDDPFVIVKTIEDDMTFKDFIHEFKKFYDIKYPSGETKKVKDRVREVSSFEKDGLCFYLEDGTKFAWSEKDSKN